MYTLLGLIQLLMITQSRLMPDFGVLWQAAPPKTEAVSNTPVQQGSGIESITANSHLPAITPRKRYTEKWIPPVKRNNLFYNLGLKRRFNRSRLIAVNKLYLVFCQWKTEG
ncbi:MAG: hypothetical protein ABI581_01010 [Sediminibacterium sp.]